MTAFIAGIYLRILAASWATFGFSKEFIRFLLIRPMVYLIVHLFLFVDDLIYPDYRNVKVEKPVFIIGHPRSGTTFFHHLLTQTDEFVVFRFWEALVPSLTLRKIIAPLLHLAIKARGDTLLPSEVGHKVSMMSVEEEEFLFLANFNTQFTLLLTPLGFSDRDCQLLVCPDEQDEPIRRRSLDFLRSCFQRQIYSLGKNRILSKLTFSGMRIRSLLEAFPDARIVYIVRCPYETIPSNLSLHRKIMDDLWGLERVPADRLQRYYERRYQYDVRFYRYMEDFLRQDILDSSQLMTIRYEDLRENLGTIVEQFARFAEVELSAPLREKIQEQIKSQKQYKPRHKNLPLQEFGLTKKQIAGDLAFIFDRYGYEK